MFSHIQQKRVQKVALAFLFLTIFIVYWLFSRHYIGPAYLSDEIGYLSKAAAFAGYPVDMASDWHGGYSILLSPLFLASSDPYVVWQAIMVLNAAMWAFSFALLFYFLRKFFPDKNFWTVFAAVVICAIYPSWIIMSGYAFSTPGFVLVFMLSIFTLQKTDETKTWSILPHSLLVGFLYWIHPTGLAVVIASFLVVLGLAWYHRRFAGLFLHSIVMIAMVAAYQVGVHVWFNEIMTPKNYSVINHYPSLSSVLQSFLSIVFWKSWIVITVGQMSYLLVATLGVLFFAVIDIGKRFKPLHETNTHECTNMLNASMGFIALSLVGILLLGALSFAMITPGHGVLDRDFWIYGRYSEMVLLPLLGIGFLALWRVKYAFSAASFVLASGILLRLYTNGANTSLNNNLVDIASFWPQALFSTRSFIFWLLLGAVGIIFVGVLKKRFFVIFVIPLFLVCILNQNIWHENILSNYSKPSSLVNLVRSNFKQGEGVSFDTFIPQQASGYQKERSKLYSYYFFNYNYRRMSPEEWLASSKGPYLTYRPGVFANSKDVQVLAREVSSGLFLVVKKHTLNTASLISNSYKDLYINLSGDNAGIINGCYSLKASDLRRFSQVGTYIGGNLVTSSKSGFLFYGPYVPLKKGNYYIQLDARFTNPEGAILDIVSNKGTEKHLVINLADYIKPYSNVIKVPFSLKSDVSDLEVRLLVNSGTELKINNYSVDLNKG